MNRQLNTKSLTNQRIAKFLGVGVLNTVFGYTAYAILIFINVPYLAALFTATVAGVVFNYFSFGRIVFYGRNGWSVFVKFVITYGVVYIANAVLLSALTEDFLLNPYAGQIICIPPSVLLSWSLMNYWVYKKD
jgi:putative flippase GtrA